jgi:hypothetical protein
LHAVASQPEQKNLPSGRGAGRDALVQQIRSLNERNVRSVAFTRRDGSVSVARAPIIVGESQVQFCRNDVHTPTLVSLRFDEIASISERKLVQATDLSAD